MLREVSAALDQRLSSLPNLPPVAFPNMNFTPPNSGPYLAVMNMPADGLLYSLRRKQNTPGVYRINIYAPVNKGPAEAENLGDRIAQHFRSESNPIPQLFIEEINFSPAITDDAEYLLPISINWRYFHDGY